MKDANEQPGEEYVGQGRGGLGEQELVCATLLVYGATLPARKLSQELI